MKEDSAPSRARPTRRRGLRRAAHHPRRHAQQQPEPYRAVMESFRAGSRGLPPRPSTYESTAATSSELSRRLGMRAYLYFSKRAVAIGSPSASILSGAVM